MILKVSYSEIEFKCFSLDMIMHSTDWFWFFVDHFFLFAGWRAVESTRPTGFCIIVHLGINGPARAKKTNSPASFFVFCVVNVCAGPVAGGARPSDDDDSLLRRARAVHWIAAVHWIGITNPMDL